MVAGRQQDRVYALTSRGRRAAIRHELRRNPGDADFAAVGDTPDWSPDGSKIAYVAAHPNPNDPPYNFFRDVHLINPDGTGDRAITASQEPALFGYDDPSWSPDGSRIAVTGAGACRTATVAGRTTTSGS